MTALDENDPRDKMILDCIVPEQLTKKPELYISISVPTEFWPLGKYNIGITAGMETSIISPPWIEGCNKMDLIITCSKHSKDVFKFSKWNQVQFGEQRPLTVIKEIEILHNCINTKIFKKLNGDYECSQSMRDLFEKIPETFNYLFVGNWLRGDLGEDRKNVGFLIKLFCEVFKRAQFIDKPGLILKTSGGVYSILDQEEILKKINSIKQSITLGDGDILPNVYIIHGDLTEPEMNSLYNMEKVKVHVTFTKGEGFGRPLLEACMSGKPIIASGWSGHLDFLNPEEAILVAGELKLIHPSAVWENVIIKESTWFHPDINHAANSLVAVKEQYNHFKKLAGKLTKKNKEQFNYNKIRTDLWNILEKYVPKFSQPVVIKELKLPDLKPIALLKVEK
jgi:glycosyltransferase involved in cell wall biosynthesis